MWSNLTIQLLQSADARCNTTQIEYSEITETLTVSEDDKLTK